jgi:hypothetical protein
MATEVLTTGDQHYFHCDTNMIAECSVSGDKGNYCSNDAVAQASNYRDPEVHVMLHANKEGYISSSRKWTGVFPLLTAGSGQGISTLRNRTY